MNLPAASRPDAPFDVAVVALSARALARSAKRAGLRALAFDLFADEDTREHAPQVVQVAAKGRALAFDDDTLLAALTEHAPAGLAVVLGAGFEDAPDLITAIDARNPVRGTSAAIVRRLKDPTGFAALMESLGIAYPEVATDAQGPGWLSKRIGASGGAHIRPLGDGEAAGAGRYAQAQVAGTTVSALFVANGRSARLLGLSDQWCDPSPDAPFRYGGAVGPLPSQPERDATIGAMLNRLTAETGLVGLASADLVRAPDGRLWLLEINPRPGATLDVFDRDGMPPLFAVHLDGCRGRLPDAAPALAAAGAACFVYAETPVTLGLSDRPAWAADWPGAGAGVPAGAPICTITATAPTCAAARDLLTSRRAALLASLRPADSRASFPNPMVSA